MEITTTETAQKLGLTAEEFIKIEEILGRTPNFTELSIFSVMWSEHCSYKNSIVWLKTLPKKSDRMLVEAGEENAGLVDIGDGLACSFKIESHNHPSALEPYQGAATGVGGINRDIFTMGARPIAQLNSLRFGNITSPKTQWLMRGVVKGIGDYGNAFGIPTVGGEVYFDECYNVNPLVNAFSAGIVETDKIASATSFGVGNPVYIVGSATGKDGIHGASFASKDISDDSIKDLPAVQVGDPFQEKLLLEATLEAIATGHLIGIQDMGAAGITCSTSEMSAKGEHGMKIYLDKVPTRQKNMQPFEILLSESQERMLIVIKKGKEAELQAIFDKWDLNCAQIGVVTDSKRLEYYVNDELVADVPADDLVLGGGAPVYHREYTEPAYYKEFQQFQIDEIEEPEDEKLPEIAKFLIGHPNIASRRWIAEQYDSMVGTANTSTNEPSDAAIVNVKGTNKNIVISVDCNSRYVNADPEKGTMIAVSEAARNIVCSGGEPVAITNCLNFGNPYIPEVYWHFVGAIKGMKAACEIFKTPVTGGNVSFYNQSSDEGPVFPTPTIGMLGLLEDIKLKMTLDFKNEGDIIYQVGTTRNDISSSEYLYSYHKYKASPAPFLDLEEEANLQNTISELIKNKVIVSAHDVSDGGLFVTLTESAMAASKDLGFSVKTTSHKVRKDAFWFGESQSRVVVSISKDKKEEFETVLKTNKVDFSELGSVVSEKVCQVDGNIWLSIDDAKEEFEATLPKYLN
ncbi:phosphoribosylformylglycinamidine synthase subunit II [Bernardetia litoralis DSM 6794]|uniref:Phosphoribosylformylglycinamidine synthase subunit PurL n=1 Tax=Bernardetia litoralis (strain ATCC 23117 / DSM 6794 / NBRC 15988 / NCIMB 1366 / Fx l1 / Sio-4) TaxID=880071 RepID=I4AM22_BERLS|nr:phosphoribosylformylglycinamidine synthase subunit PurL [Bernardetia litoralis]AFM05007.1 phosphoribosylformylglycinamidine synthase subunit II [Bernardetia litoralis DSM 6794]